MEIKIWERPSSSATTPGCFMENSLNIHLHRTVRDAFHTL